MTTAILLKAFNAGEMIILPGSGGAPRRVPVFARGFGSATEKNDFPRKMRKLLRAVVAFKAQRRKK
jgi:hypothetical protein